MEVNIDQVATAFADWRSTRTKRGHTPSHRINQAVSLAGKYTKLQITTRLGINHKMLNRWINCNPIDNTFIDMTPHYAEINRKPLEVAVNGGCFWR